MKTMEEIIMAVISVALLVFFILVLGETTISFSPFSIKMEAWDKLIGILLIILGAGFLRYYHKRIDREEFIEETREFLDQEIARESESKVINFRMILYRSNTKELREEIESLGILPLTSPSEGGYILVAGNRYSIIYELDESIPELYDCGLDKTEFLDSVKRSVNVFDY